MHEDFRGWYWFVLLAAGSYMLNDHWNNERTFSSPWISAWASGMLLYELAYWIVSFADLFVCSVYPDVVHRCKLVPRGQQKQEPNSWLFMAGVSLGNQVSQLLITFFVFYATDSWRSADSHRSTHAGAAAALASGLFYMLIGLVLFDVFFWLGHRILHAPSLYRQHKLHHSSLATAACSGHFMSPLDFLLESSGCLACCIVVHNWFAFPHLAFALGLSISGFNTALVHSGWDVHWLPSPRRHFEHHMRSKVNYGIGLVDAMMGTSAS